MHREEAGVAPRGRPAVGTSGKLWLHVHLPQLPLEILVRGDAGARACVLAGGPGGQRRVLLATRHAAVLGVRAGMPLGAARVLGDLQVLDRDEPAEQRALEQLCAWAYQYTSCVSPVAPDGLLLEVAGSLRLWGGLEALSRSLRQGLKKLGYKGCFAVAPTPLAATVLARAQPHAVVTAQSELIGHLGTLAVEVLRFDPAQIEALHSMGVHTIGDCLRLPRDGVGRRLGPGIVTTLDRMVGRLPDPRVEFVLPRVFASRLDLPWEVADARALGVACDRLLHELVAYLGARCAMAGRLHWCLRHAGNTRTPLPILLAAPSREHAHLAMLMRERLARTTLPAPVRGLDLLVDDIVDGTPSMVGDLFGQSPEARDENWPGFIDRLRSRLGDRAVQGLEVVCARRPEHAWRYLPPRPAAAGVGERHQGARANTSWAARRPVWLTRRPLPLGERGGIPEFGGPLRLLPDRERIESGWWDGDDVARDYFVAITPGGTRLWVFREITGPRAWYLHGIFE